MNSRLDPMAELQRYRSAGWSKDHHTEFDVMTKLFNEAPRGHTSDPKNQSVPGIKLCTSLKSWVYNVPGTNVYLAYLKYGETREELETFVQRIHYTPHRFYSRPDWHYHPNDQAKPRGILSPQELSDACRFEGTVLWVDHKRNIKEFGERYPHAPDGADAAVLAKKVRTPTYDHFLNMGFNRGRDYYKCWTYMKSRKQEPVEGDDELEIRLRQ